MYTTVSKSHVTECLFTQEVGVLCRNLIHEQHHEQTISAAFEQVRDKPACTSTVDGKRLEILDLESRGNVFSDRENKGADQLCSYFETDLCLWFCICKMLGFSHIKILFVDRVRDRT